MSRVTAASRCCHVIACDASGFRVIAAGTPVGWMLPLVSQDIHATVEEAYPVARADLFSGAIDDYFLVHTTRFEFPPGSGTIHGCCVMRACAPDRGDWRRIETLLASTAALPEQAFALRAAWTRLRAPEMPFDALTASEEVQRWIQSVLDERFAGEVLSQIAWRRLARTDAVGTCYTANGRRLFLKAGPHRATDEAQLASAVNAQVPRAAPETVVLDVGRCRWLVGDVGGYQVPLLHRTVEWYLRVIDQSSRLQRSLLDDGDVMRSLSARSVDAASLAEVIPFIVRSAMHAGFFEHRKATPEQLECSLWRVMERLAALKSPPHWVNFDLSFDNLHVREDGTLCFIDLEYGCAGPPSLSYGILLREAAQRGGTEIAKACEERILSLWADDARAPWQASLHDLPVLALLLKTFVLRIRSADYHAESLETVETMYHDVFERIAVDVAKRAMKNEDTVFAR